MLRRTIRIVLVNANNRAALRKYENESVIAEPGDFQTLWLDSLVPGTFFGIVPNARDLVFKRQAAVEQKFTGLVENGKASRSALPVTFIRDDKTVAIDPLDGVGFSRNCSQGAVECQRAFLLRVHIGQINRTGGKVGYYRAIYTIDDDNMIIFLQCDSELIGAVEVNELRLRVVTCNSGKAGYIYGFPRCTINGA